MSECSIRVGNIQPYPTPAGMKRNAFGFDASPTTLAHSESVSVLLRQWEKVDGSGIVGVASCRKRCHFVVYGRSSSVVFRGADEDLHLLWRREKRGVACCAIDPSHAWIAFGCEKDVIVVSFENGSDLAFLEAHNAAVTMIRPIYKDILLSVGDDLTFAVWDVREVEIVHQSVPLSRSSAVTCAAVETVEIHRVAADPIEIHRVAFGFENATIQVWENRPEFANRWECALEKKVMLHGAAALAHASRGEDESTSVSASSAAVVSPSVRDLEFVEIGGRADDAHACANPLFDCASYRNMVAPRSLLAAITCSTIFLFESKSWTLLWSIEIADVLAEYNYGKNGTTIGDARVEGDARRILVLLKTVFGNPWAFITLDVSFALRAVHCCEDPPEGTPSMVLRTSINKRSCLKLGLQKREEALADAAASNLSKISVAGHRGRTVRSSGYGKTEVRPMFKPKTNRRSSLPPIKREILPPPAEPPGDGFTETIENDKGTRRGTWNIIRGHIDKGQGQRQCFPSRFEDWSAAGLRCQNHLQTPTRSIRRLVSTSGKRQIALVPSDRRVLVFHNLSDASKNDTFAVLTGHDSEVCDVGFSHSGSQMVSAGLNGSLYVHDWRQARLVGESSSPAGARISSRSSGATSQFFFLDKFIVSSVGRDVRLLAHVNHGHTNLESTSSVFPVLGEFGMDCHEVTSIAVRNDVYSHLVLCTGSDKSLFALDLNAGRVSLRRHDVHERPVARTAMFPDAPDSSHLPAGAHDLFLTSAPVDGVKLWDLRCVERSVARFSAHPSRTYASGFSVSPCGRFLATSSDSAQACIYDLRFPGSPSQKVGQVGTTAAEPVIDVAFQSSRGSAFPPALVVASIHGNLSVFNYK